MYNYAFFSRVLAIFILVLVGLVSFPLSIQHFRLKKKVTDAQNIIQDAAGKQVILNNIMPELFQYAQKDASLNPIFQKYRIPIPPAPESPKQKKK